MHAIGDSYTQFPDALLSSFLVQYMTQKPGRSLGIWLLHTLFLQNIEDRIGALEGGGFNPKGPEPILTCVQCSVEYKESENAGQPSHSSIENQVKPFGVLTSHVKAKGNLSPQREAVSSTVVS